MRRRRASRDQARPIAAPGIDDNEHISESVHPGRDVSFFVRFVVTNRDALLIMQDGRGLSEINAVLFKIRSRFP